MPTLFVIERALSDLFDARQELIDEVAFIDEQIADKQAALDAVDAAIVNTVTAEIRKVDNISRFLLELKARREALAKESERLNNLATVAYNTETRIKEMVLQIMRDTDTKKLEGKIGTLRRQANGGVQGVEVKQPELVPTSYQQFSLTMSGIAYRHIQGLCASAPQALSVLAMAKAEPDLTAIRKALEAGEGIPGCVLKDRGEQLRVG